MRKGLINIAALLLLLIVWTTKHGGYLNEIFFLKHNIGNASDTRLDKFKSSNKIESLAKSLKAMYGDVRSFRIQPVGTKLDSKEEEMFKECVKTGPKDRDRSGPKFRATEHIRRTNHTYLAKKKDAVILEVGGNKGNDVSEFVRLYNPRYIVLEPLEEYANMLKTRFKKNPRVTVINTGLGTKNKVDMVKKKGINETSKHSGRKRQTRLFITNTTDFLRKIGLGHFDIDLLTMDCDGCEFEVLENILSTNHVKHLRNIQFSTNSTIKGLEEPIQRYCKIQQLLWRTHRPTYQFKLVWESWRRRDLSYT